MLGVHLLKRYRPPVSCFPGAVAFFGHTRLALPHPDPPDQTSPVLTQPALPRPNQTRPRLDRPRPTMPALPYQTAAGLTRTRLTLPAALYLSQPHQCRPCLPCHSTACPDAACHAGHTIPDLDTPHPTPPRQLPSWLIPAARTPEGADSAVSTTPTLAALAEAAAPASCRQT